MRLINSDNMNIPAPYIPDESVDVVFADYVYESDDFRWVSEYGCKLKYGGLFFAMTDYHTYAEFTMHMKENMRDMNFVSMLTWVNDWGRKKEDRWRDVIDYIIVFSKGEKFKFYPERVQVPKITKSKGLNPSGRETKIGTNLIDGICLTTTAKERVKQSDGHLIRWQKPLKLYEYLLGPTTDAGDVILDPFMGSGSCGVWAKQNGRDYVGVEIDSEVFAMAKKRIEETSKSERLALW